MAGVRRTPATKPDLSDDALDPFERVVGDPVTFAERHWGHTPLLRRPDGSFDDVLSLDDVDALIGSSPRRPTVRMVKAGTPVDPSQYCSRARLGGRDLDDIVDARKVANQLHDGATLVLQSLHRTWAPAAKFADGFAAAASHTVQLNAYLTPPGAAGLAEHADDHDVFVLQIAGTKDWCVSGLGDLTVRAGDVLYVPAGCRHSAATAETLSLHVTLGVLRTTYRSVVERLLRSTSAVEWDAPLPLGYRHRDDAALGTGIAAALQRAVATLGEACIDEVATRERGRTRDDYDRTGRISTALLGDTIDADAVLHWATAPPRVEAIDDDPGRRRVVMGDVTLRVPQAVIPAIVQLAGHRSGTRVSELPGLDAPSRLVLARRLLRSGVCRLQLS